MIQLVRMQKDVEPLSLFPRIVRAVTVGHHPIPSWRDCSLFSPEQIVLHRVGFYMRRILHAVRLAWLAKNLAGMCSTHVAQSGQPSAEKSI